MFTDDQFNIPDKFDENYHILGKGNGIPDILDEAMWGTMFWEYMQETNGQIHWGTETKGYSPFTTYENDPTRFGTEVVRSAVGQLRVRDVHAHGPLDQAVQCRPLARAAEARRNGVCRRRRRASARRTGSTTPCRSTC